MPLARLTDRAIKSLRVQDAQQDFNDADPKGFGLRVGRDGTKTFFFRYRLNGARPRFWIGTYPAISLATARNRARELYLEVARGVDPLEGARSAKVAPSFGELAEEYLDAHARRKKRSWQEDERRLRTDVLPVWEFRKAHEIARRDVIHLLDRIVGRGSPISANRTRALISKVFNFGIGRALLEANPVVGVPRPAKESRRERVLSNDEIRAVWAATLELPLIMGSTFRFRLLTAQRGGEVLAMRWEDIADGCWTIPARRAKNGLAHRVPLVQQSAAILEQIRRRTARAPWVFASSRKPEQPTSAINKATERLVRLSGVDFVAHDLRRTAATRMASLGIPRLVIAKILNHADSGVTAIYDRHSYDGEKREALGIWGNQVETILRG